jgi:hypothetical protein
MPALACCLHVALMHDVHRLLIMMRARFTAWMGANSSSTKQRRLLGELVTTMAASGHVPPHRFVGMNPSPCYAILSRTLSHALNSFPEPGSL